jgi:AcrR family transcriptional regulator
MNTARTSNRDNLLTAAVRVIVRDGLLSLTLEAVAKEAGLSKGGLLHHFPSKEALLAAMIEHFLQRQEDEMLALVAADPNPVGRWTRAYLQASLAPTNVEGLSLPQTRQAHVALMAAVAINPALTVLVKAFADRWTVRLLEEGGDPLDHLVTWLAADGLWLWDLFGLLPSEGNLREQLVERIRSRSLEGHS